MNKHNSTTSKIKCTAKFVIPGLVRDFGNDKNIQDRDAEQNSA